jgi:hypothetical protein
MHDTTAATIIFKKLPRPPSLADLAMAFRLKIVQAVPEDISTTSGNRKRGIDELHWNSFAPSLRTLHTCNPNAGFTFHSCVLTTLRENLGRTGEIM